MKVIVGGIGIGKTTALVEAAKQAARDGRLVYLLVRDAFEANRLEQVHGLRAAGVEVIASDPTAFRQRLMGIPGENLRRIWIGVDDVQGVLAGLFWHGVDAVAVAGFVGAPLYLREYPARFPAETETDGDRSSVDNAAPG